MDYSNFLIMNHELSLIVVLILTLLADLTACGNKKCFQYFAIGLFTLHTFLGFFAWNIGEAESFGGMFVTSEIHCFMKNILNIGTLLIFLFGFEFFDSIARGISSNPIVISLLFFGMLFFANELLSLPFGIYQTFTIEEKFGFNKMTPSIFATDLLKEWIMTILLGGVLISLLILFYQHTGKYFWIIAWGVMAAINIFMMMFYSNLIVPMFNKQTPLEEGELRTEIEQFCQTVGYQLDNLYVIDGSKRTTKANAYFSGLGAKKRIVLYDTLINMMTPKEIVAVLAHEIGHYKHKHTRIMLTISLLNIAILFFLALLVAAVTSSISMLEVAVAYLVEEKKISRIWACVILFAICWVVGAVCSLSFGPLSHIKIDGGNIFDFFDNLSSNILMTLGSLLTVLFVGWRLKKTDVYDEFTNGGTLSTNARIFGVLWFLIRYICPLAILIIFISGLF